jgi:hypothetical protein
LRGIRAHGIARLIWLARLGSADKYRSLAQIKPRHAKSAQIWADDVLTARSAGKYFKTRLSFWIRAADTYGQGHRNPKSIRPARPFDRQL